MTDITMHLTANFYPPIPADIQLSVQEIFDELKNDSMPYILGWSDIPEDWEYEVSDDSVFDREYILPNGATVTGRSLLSDLRLEDALWWDCDEPNESYAEYRRWQENVDQLELPL
jgi:hypothetical protein